jgi:hypothetical protein
MIPVGVRGSLRQQRSAAYLAPESIRNRITPEQLAANLPITPPESPMIDAVLTMLPFLFGSK